MDEKERIEKDIELFNKNLEKIDLSKANEKVAKLTELAKQYYKDAKYYLEREDFFTAFGCINYAHGLLDAIIKNR
jgi:hypothetical protein